MKLSVIIPVFNNKNLLQRCIAHLQIALSKITAEIIVVDNGSDENIKELLDDKIKYTRLNKNYGFTGAVNQGAQKALGQYLLILNSDCFLQENSVDKMISFIQKNAKFIATQPVVYTSENKIESVGFKIDISVGRALIIKDQGEWQKPSSSYIYGLSGTCLLMRADIFKKIGMFDQSFHSYLEDVDLFIRLHKVGYTYYPTFDAKVSHMHMATSNKMGNYKQKQDFKNWIRIILKNFSPLFILKHFPLLFIERLKNLSGLLKTYL